MSYPLVIYDKNGDWKRVLNEDEEKSLRPEYKRFNEWKTPETAVAPETVQIQNDVFITPETPVTPIAPIRKPGRPPKRY